MTKIIATLIRSVMVALMLSTAHAGPDFALRSGTLWLGDRAVLQNVPPEFSTVKDPNGTGVFLKLSATQSAALICSPLGRIAGMRRFTSCHRVDPFWMVPAVGTNDADVASETQWLLAETASGDCVMVVPLLAGPCRFALNGDTNGLNLTGETADPAVVTRGGVAVFISVGNDPYQMADAGAAAVMQKLGTGKLRRDKPLPDFVNDFGWCTWNSFYHQVSMDKVRAGLASFAAGKVEPRFMILDDGWQDYRKMPGGEERLVSLAPNQQRFGGDLTQGVRMAKHEFKIQTFLVWHTIMGYWGGVDGIAVPGYDVKNTTREFNPAILKLYPDQNNQWGNTLGLISPERIGKFYDDYYQRLQAQGVDGVKVDSQDALESVAHGLGGRLALITAYRQALEKSVAKYFDGRLINCMASAMENYYCSPGSTLMRTSTDFWPKTPQSHGAHVYCNAQVGLWFGEFMQPDWDMFQSDHPLGLFHAAARAVSGGPVYVSDVPGAQNFDLLRKLVLSDGTILRADLPGRPTRDCLFADVTREPVLLKVFNSNRDCGVIGAFNANYHADETSRQIINGNVSPSDVPGLQGSAFAAFAQNADKVWRCGKDNRAPIRLAEGEWEIISFAPVNRGVAVLGLADKLNSTGAVTIKQWNADGSYDITLRDGGKFVAWAEHTPESLEVNGQPGEFTYDAASGRLSAQLPAHGKITVTLRWRMVGEPIGNQTMARCPDRNKQKNN